LFLKVLRGDVQKDKLQEAWAAVEARKTKRKNQLTAQTWPCAFCKTQHTWAAFAADVNADPLSQINAYVLQPGSWRCCQRFRRRETAAGSDVPETNMYRCSKCTEERAPNYYDKDWVLKLTEAAKLDKLVCRQCDPSFFKNCIGCSYRCSVCKTQQPFEEYLFPVQTEIRSGRRADIRCGKCQCPPCQGCGERRLVPKLGIPPDPSTYYCDKCGKFKGKLKFCSGCNEWKNVSAYPAHAQAVVAAAGHIMNGKHRCSLCNPEKPKQTCAVCKNQVALDELHHDGDYVAWRCSNGARRLHWCSSCAFPTCRACGTRPEKAIKRNAAEFVDIKSKEWYRDKA
jgi:hypothetical protein